MFKSVISQLKATVPKHLREPRLGYLFVNYPVEVNLNISRSYCSVSSRIVDLLLKMNPPASPNSKKVSFFFISVIAIVF